MRRKLNRQTNLFTAVSSNPIARELEEISKIIDANPGVLDLVYQDLVKAKRHDTGREGLTAEQVLRCCILKQYRQLLGARSASDRRRYFYKHRIRHNGDVPARHDGLPNPQGFSMSWFILKQGCDDDGCPPITAATGSGLSAFRQWRGRCLHRRCCGCSRRWPGAGRPGPSPGASHVRAGSWRCCGARRLWRRG